RASLVNDSLCDTVETELALGVSADLGAKALEDFELPPPWLRETSLDGRTTGVWAAVPSAADPGDMVLRALDAPTITDTAVLLPPVEASASEDLVLSFVHTYDFELSDGILWDGGVIEITRDGGATWDDVEIPGTLEPGYDGALSNRADNPLSDRRAFGGQNPSFPAEDAVTLNFGTRFAGETVQLRFRVGTDQSVGAPGWEIDDLEITGSVDLAFPALVPDASDCAGAPVADPGMPQTVFGGEAVVLDGSMSMDPDGDPLTFAWSALDPDGPMLDATDAAMVGFIAPDVTEETLYAFRLSVTDGVGSDTADTTVNVLVAPPPPPPDMGLPDMGVDLGAPDAGVPDMGVPPTDMGAPADDMIPPADMGGEEAPADSGGCGCHVTGPLGAAAGPQAIFFAFLALLDWRRRRRR
ncbi:MAG: MYXO-CTERM sorting domain-containing protein, partial [Myxococcota bacterium]